MANKVRSARGDIVDFDLIKIKQQIASRTPTQDVRARQDFIERKLHRRLKKTGSAPIRKQAPNPPPRIDAVKVQPKMPGTTPAVPGEQLNVPQPAERTKQKARPPKPNTNNGE